MDGRRTSSSGVRRDCKRIVRESVWVVDCYIACFVAEISISMSDSPPPAPLTASQRLMELKRKILKGGDKAPQSASPAAAPTPPLPVPPARKERPSKPSLTLRSLMSSKRKSADVKDDSPVANPLPAVSPAEQPPSKPFVSRLKEAPAHRANNGLIRSNIVSFKKVSHEGLDEEPDQHEPVIPSPPLDEAHMPSVHETILKLESRISTDASPRMSDVSPKSDTRVADPSPKNVVTDDSPTDASPEIADNSPKAPPTDTSPRITFQTPTAVMEDDVSPKSAIVEPEPPQTVSAFIAEHRQFLKRKCEELEESVAKRQIASIPE
jgi:hypothetical protein